MGIAHEALLAVVHANADTLTELRMEGSGSGIRLDGASPRRALALVGQVQAVLGAAPRLRLLAADVDCNDVAVAHRLLRNEGAFAALRVRKMHVSTRDEAGVLALAADLPAHTWLTEVRLHLSPLGTLAVLDAVVDAALELRLHSLLLNECHITPASAPALARLISGGALTELYVSNEEFFDQQLFDQPAAALIANALRANSMLTSLELVHCCFWRNEAGAALVLDALAAHRSMRTLNLCNNNAYGNLAPALGAALGALVAADAPPLHELNVSANRMGDAGLRALVGALPLNTHLLTLNLADNLCTDAFIRNRLLPALRANTSLLHLSAVGNFEAEDNHYMAYPGDDGEYRNPLTREAEALVRARRAAAP